MRIYINGQDIKQIHFADIDSSSKVQTFEVEPDSFLKVFDGFLYDIGYSIDQIKELYVVVGPGSATALRTILSIVNTCHFTKKIPLYGIEKDREISDSDVINRIKNNQIEFVEHENYLFPIYERNMGITLSTRDSLGRKK